MIALAWNQRSSDTKTSLVSLVPVNPAAVQQAEAGGHFQVLHSQNRTLLAYSGCHWPSWPLPLGPTCLFSLSSHSVLASGTQSLHLHNGNSYQPCPHPSLGPGFLGAGHISKAGPSATERSKAGARRSPGSIQRWGRSEKGGDGGAAGWEGTPVQAPCHSPDSAPGPPLAAGPPRPALASKVPGARLLLPHFHSPPPHPLCVRPPSARRRLVPWMPRSSSCWPSC